MKHDALDLQQPFTDQATVAGYATDTPRKVPGYADLHRMALQLLAEHAPETANILVLGAGGGLELKAFAEARPRWSFMGVDPSAEMLGLARSVLGPLARKVRLVHGYIEDAPLRSFDGASCLLTLHFLPKAERLRTLQELRQRLKPGATLVVAHHSCPQEGKLQQWLMRSVSFPSGSDVNLAETEGLAASMAQRLPILSAVEDESLFNEAGFSDVALFYAGFTFRGWIAAA